MIKNQIVFVGDMVEFKLNNGMAVQGKVASIHICCERRIWGDIADAGVVASAAIDMGDVPNGDVKYYLSIRTNRLKKDMQNYPEVTKNIIWMGIELTTLNYIKENCPEAWFRPLFDPDHPLRKELDALQNNN